ncbi:MAG: DUF4177 domain-containing protein [Microgenomates group bacterium]
MSAESSKEAELNHKPENSRGKWEYKALHVLKGAWIDIEINSEKIKTKQPFHEVVQNELNKLSEQGWELVSAAGGKAETLFELLCLLKRPKMDDKK